jgi:carboxyl-terminal processing protease
MKFKHSILFSLLAAGLLFSFVYPEAISNEQKEKVLLETMMRTMGRYHFNPQELNDEFSEKAFKQSLEAMDGGKRFFTAQEVSQLEKYRHQLDDQLQAGEFTYFNLALELNQQALERAQTYYQEILDQPFDFSKSEVIELDGDKRDFERNPKALREYWRKYLKYEALERYAESLEKREKGEEEYVDKTDAELEAKAREDVRKLFDRWFDRLSTLDREDRISQYFNAVLSVYDPHTNYYKPIDKENFDIRFSGKLEGIGAQLTTEDDYTKVSNIIIGGPAWKGKELEEDDIITKVAQEGEEPVDIKGMVLDDVVQLIRGDKGTKVTLTVEKVDGTTQQITITRDVVILDERFAKSLILEGQAPGEKIGYISLPGFYADFRDRNGRHSADDVAKEIEKLKAENVDGIILDLRNNGGGSLRDVVKMSGFFIEEGPIVQVKSRNYEPEVLTDVDPSVKYNGPLVVMVNNISASASEILAAALQDYGRAVIVGSTSTFGKGTVQRFIDLDRTLRGFDNVKPLGQVKLTTQKFYRINGGATQLRGVTPDIILPDNYAAMAYGEREEEYPLPWTEIPAVEYEQNVLRLAHLEEIKARSAARVADNETFSKIQANANRLKALREQTDYPLALADYQHMQDTREKDSEAYADIMDAVVNPSVRNLKVDLPAFDMDESKAERNKEFLESTSKDIYLKEVLAIMHDIIELETVAMRD